MHFYLMYCKKTPYANYLPKNKIKSGNPKCDSNETK